MVAPLELLFMSSSVHPSSKVDRYPPCRILAAGVMSHNNIQVDVYEYRHVVLPPEIAQLLPKGKLLSEVGVMGVPTADVTAICFVFRACSGTQFAAAASWKVNAYAEGLSTPWLLASVQRWGSQRGRGSFESAPALQQLCCSHPRPTPLSLLYCSLSGVALVSSSQGDGTTTLCTALSPTSCSSGTFMEGRLVKP
eukprot:1157872-Pelagomonas_calceolata.AAC.3